MSDATRNHDPDPGALVVCDDESYPHGRSFLCVNPRPVARAPSSSGTPRCPEHGASHCGGESRFYECGCVTPSGTPSREEVERAVDALVSACLAAPEALVGTRAEFDAANDRLRDARAALLSLFPQEKP